MKKKDPLNTPTRDLYSFDSHPLANSYETEDLKNKSKYLVNDYKELAEFYTKAYDTAQLYSDDVNLLIDKMNELYSNVERTKHILVTQFNSLGDAMLISDFLYQLRYKYPDYKITLATYENVAPIFVFCPYIDNIVTLSMKQMVVYDRNQYWYIDLLSHKALDLIMQMVDKIWLNGIPSISIHPQWSEFNKLGNLLALLSGAKDRHAYYARDYDRFYTDEKTGQKRTVQLIENDLYVNHLYNLPLEIVRNIDKHRYIVERMNDSHPKIDDIISSHKELKLFIDPSIQIELEEKFNIIICIGGSVPSKKYPVKKLAKALNEIYSDNIKFLIIGGEDEIVDSYKLCDLLPENSYANYVNQLSIHETMHVISKSNMYIGNDTGMVHVAAAFHIPCIILYKESIEKMNSLGEVQNHISAYRCFFPYDYNDLTPLLKDENVNIESKSNAIALRPEKSLHPCAERKYIYNGCDQLRSHCISQINYKDIVKAFVILMEKLC